MSVADSRGNILYVNKKFCEVSGYSSEELIGENHRIINSGYHPRSFFEEMWQTISTGKTWHGDVKNRAKDGSFYWVNSTIFPFLDHQGKPCKYVSIRTEITTQKRVEEELRSLSSELEMATKLKSEFLAQMSHELRTPLNGIIGFAEILEDGIVGEVNPDQKEYLHEISSNGHHLLLLINQILDLAKIESGKIEIHLEPVLPPQVLEEVMASLSIPARQNKTKILTNVCPNLKEVRTDRIKLKQILLNLISNAIKFSKEHGEVYVDIHSQDPHHFTVSVSDNGTGIKPQDMDRLFKDFEQLHKESTIKQKGTGLGLSLTKKLVAIQGGTIQVKSEHGKGSTFTVKLPKNGRQAGHLDKGQRELECKEPSKS